MQDLTGALGKATPPSLNNRNGKDEMVNYLTTWAQITGDAYNEGNLFLWIWGIGAQLLPFVGVTLAVVGLAFGAFKLWEERGF